MLLPTSQDYWLQPAIDRLQNERNEVAQKSLTLVLWYAQTESADKAIAAFAADASKPSEARDYAKQIMQAKERDRRETASRGACFQRSLAASKTSGTYEGGERRSLDRPIDLDVYTMMLLAKRNDIAVPFPLTPTLSNMRESDTQKLITEASQALDNQQYAAAEELQRRAIQLLEAQASEATRIVDELEKLASIHFQQGKFGLAASGYDRVLKSREASLPATDAQILRVLYWQGKSYFNDMKYDLAEAAFRRALAASEGQPNSPRDVAQFLSELGFLLYYLGRYREAEPYLLRALPLYETLHGANHPGTVWVLERIALNYDHCPEIGKDPEPYFQKAA